MSVVPGTLPTASDVDDVDDVLDVVLDVLESKLTLGCDLEGVNAVMVLVLVVAIARSNAARWNLDTIFIFRVGCFFVTN